VDVSQINLTTSILSSKINVPICISATAMNKMAHPEGEAAVAKGLIFVYLTAFATFA